MKGKIEIYQDEARQLFGDEIEAQLLADDCGFTEGPVWNKEGFYLFSDIAANCIYRIQPGKGKEMLIPESGTSHLDDPFIRREQAGSNGLAYDSDGTLLVCRHGSHMVAKYINGKLAALADAFEGRPFNSPNDIVVHPDGSIYFSDPPYGLKETKLHPERFQPRAGVYCYRQGRIELVSDRYQYPNGVCLSPDGKKLYISSNKPAERFVSEHDAATNQFLRVFAGENGDGLKCGPDGNFYLCANEGVVILDAKGKRLAKFSFEKTAANLCFGGEGKRDLFLTAREHIYLVPGFLKR